MATKRKPKPADEFAECEDQDGEKKGVLLRLDPVYFCKLQAVVNHRFGPKNQQTFIHDAVTAALDAQIAEIRELETKLAKVK